MPQGDRAVRMTAALTAGCLVATLVGVVVSSRPAGGRLSEATATPAPLQLSVAASVGDDLIPAVPAAQLPPAPQTRATRSATSMVISEGPVRFVSSCDQDVAPGHFACYAERRTDIAAQPDVTAMTAAVSTPRGLHPADLSGAYGLPSADAGAGQTVYIIDAFDDPSAESDLAAYRTQFELPDCTTLNGCFRKLNASGQTGPLPAPNTDWAGETSLDLDMVSAVCPNCNITLIEAGDTGTGMFTAVKRANLLGARFVSMSWGGPETTAKTMASMDQTYFAATGVVYTAASGDDGYAKGVIYPATSNRVVSVGGTALTSTPTTTRGWSETAWSGSGSGCSSFEPAADWQAGSTPCATRGTTDVSAVADPATGVSVYQTYGANGWTVYGGTSAATPIIASVFALAGSPNPTLNPTALLYRHPSNLYDITSGSTGSCSPAALCHGTDGWDGPTGLGTPHGVLAFQLGRTAHTTAPGHVLSPGWPHS
jgi:subtilisin family serine protease